MRLVACPPIAGVTAGLRAASHHRQVRETAASVAMVNWCIMGDDLPGSPLIPWHGETERHLT